MTRVMWSCATWKSRVRRFQKTIVQQPRGMGEDEALRGHRHAVAAVAAAAAVAFRVHFYDDDAFRQLSILPIAL